MTKLHLGCGKRRINDFINIDIQPMASVDIVGDIRNLPCDDNTVEEIYSCAAIEHFGRHDWKDAISHWHTKLKPGGTLRLSTPDFEACVEEYRQNGRIHELFGLIVGGQKDYTDQHGMIFDYKFLKKELESLGFCDIERYDWREFHPFQNQPGYDDFSRAYLPHMDMEKGRLMSLNIVCKKRKEIK